MPKLQILTIAAAISLPIAIYRIEPILDFILKLNQIN